jgi:hypothetical protein
MGNTKITQLLDVVDRLQSGVIIALAILEIKKNNRTTGV